MVRRIEKKVERGTKMAPKTESPEPCSCAALLLQDVLEERSKWRERQKVPNCFVLVLLSFFTMFGRRDQNGAKDVCLSGKRTPHQNDSFC